MMEVTSISGAIINCICTPQLVGALGQFHTPLAQCLLLPSKLEKLIDIESPLAEKAIMRVPSQRRREGRGRHRQKGSSGELDLRDPPGPKGFSSPKQLDTLTLGH